MCYFHFVMGSVKVIKKTITKPITKMVCVHTMGPRLVELLKTEVIGFRLWFDIRFNLVTYRKILSLVVRFW
jgi:hypothetical protein